MPNSKFTPFARALLVVKRWLTLIIALCLSPSISLGQTTETFAGIGTNVWVCPAGVTTVTVQLWGGGGAGGGGNNGGNPGGDGGGGGEFVQSVIAVVPGVSYTVEVGRGGLGGANANGENGFDSYFSTSLGIVAQANGGGGGAREAGGTGAGGTGGIGDITADGGTGGTGVSAGSGKGGGGGGGAGSDGAFGAITGGNGVNGPGAGGGAGGGDGGNGGKGTNSNGNNGSTLGGGGGGGGDDNGESGGNGADGQGVLVYISSYTLDSNNPASTVSVLCPSSTNDIIYTFNISGAGASVDLTEFKFTTGGAFAAADITRYELWHDTDAGFAGAAVVDNVVPTGGSGTNETFTGFTQALSGGGATDYFWITVDVAAAPTAGNTLNVTAASSNSLTVSASAVTGNGNVGSTHTFGDNTYWSGVTDTDWATATNWCNAVPTSTDNVIIPGAAFVPNQPTITALDAAECANITINATATLTLDGSSNLDLYGDWINNGTLVHNTGKISFRGSADQTVTGGATETFYDIDIKKIAGPGTVNFLAPTTSAVMNDLTFKNTNTGHFNAPQTLSLTQSADADMIMEAGNIGDLTAGTTININDDWENNNLAADFVFGTSTVNFQGAGSAQVIGGTVATQSFYHVTLSGAGTNIQMDSHLDIDGNLTIGDDTDLDAATNTRNITIAGNWDNNENVPSDGFGEGTATVTFNGTGAQTITHTANTETFYNLIIDGTGGSVDATGLTTINNQDFTMQTSNSSTYDGPTTQNINGDVLIGAGNSATWTAGAAITLDGDWTNNGAIGDFDGNGGTVTLEGSVAAQNITGTASTTFDGLTFNNSLAAEPRYIIGVNTNVEKTLTMSQGNVNLGAFNLTLGVSNAVPGILVHDQTLNDGWMYGTGNFIRWFAKATIADGHVDGLFPLGNAATDFRPFYVNPSGAPTTEGTISVSHTDATGSDTPVSFPDGGGNVSLISDTKWTMSTGGGLTGGSYDISGAGTSFGTVGNVDDLRLVQAAGVVGTAGVNAGTLANPTVKRTGLSLANLSNDFHFGSVNKANTPLPIELIDFKVEYVGSGVQLTWVTATETNNDFFTIEYSSDGIYFKEVIIQPSAAINGNSTSILTYSHFHNYYIPGLYYYRLKQTDYDGKYSYSAIESVRIIDKDDVTFEIGPNPNKGDELFLYFVNLTVAPLISVTDINGNEVPTKQIVANNKEGRYEVEFSPPLNAGYYNVIADVNGKIFSKGMLVVNK